MPCFFYSESQIGVSKTGRSLYFVVSFPVRIGMDGGCHPSPFRPEGYGVRGAGVLDFFVAGGLVSAIMTSASSMTWDFPARSRMHLGS
jgi:hypothetical protein